MQIHHRDTTALVLSNSVEAGRREHVDKEAKPQDLSPSPQHSKIPILVSSLSYGLNGAGLSDASPESKFCSTCVKALHRGHLPAADCGADGDVLDQEHRFIGAADVVAPIIQRHARDLYEELINQALSSASPVNHDGPTAQVVVHRGGNQPVEDPVIVIRKRLASAILKTALRATIGQLPFTIGDSLSHRIYRLDEIEIRIILRQNFFTHPWFRL